MAGKDAAPATRPWPPEVVGHAAVADRFRRVVARGRLASTYLFTGPAGVGKRLFADRLAAALLCDAPTDRLEPCGRCPSCALLRGGSHPDLLVVEKPEGRSGLPIELFIGAGDKRNRAGMCHELAMRPMTASRRVAIIDDADALGVESANCLLKTLEEPPPRSVLLLIGTSASKQLPTIRSRSQVVRFGALADDDVARVLQAPPLGVPPAEAGRLAAASRGSVARALAAADGRLADAAAAVRDCLEAGRFDAGRLTKTLDDESKAAGAEPRQRRRRLAELVAVAADHYRDRARQLAATTDTAALDAAVAAVDRCLQADEALARNANQGALAQHLAIELSRLARGAPS